MPFLEKYLDANLKLISYILFMVFFYQSCAPTTLLQNNYGLKALRKPINEIIIDSGLDVSIGIKMVSIKSGKTLYELNSEKLFTPASNIKLFTLATALHYLGENHVFKTRVYKYKDNLILKGSGDPDLSVKELDSLAYRTSKFISTVDTLFLDASQMDSTYYGNGWMWDEGSWWYAAPVNALSLNDNCIDFIISPGKLGKPANVKTYPETNYISYLNNSKTVRQTNNFKKISIIRDWKNKKNNFTISGNLHPNAIPDTLRRNIENPSLYTGTIFKKLLKKYGVSVKQVSTLFTNKKGNQIASHSSKGLLHSSKNLMNESDNLTAELFIKKIGSINNNQGNWKNGLSKMKSFLNDSVGIDTTQIRIADGSGLSRYNLVNASEITKFLEWIFKSQYKKDFISCLPNGGMKKGTMENRLNTAGERIRVKTGGLSGITNISGYIFSKKYGPIAFSILTSGYVGNSNPFRALQDNIILSTLYD